MNDQVFVERRREITVSHGERKIERCSVPLKPHAPIVKSSSNSRKAFRSAVLIFCTAGFLYQTAVTLIAYFKYPTVLDVRFEQIKGSDLPGITFCYNKGISGVRYCKLYPSHCVIVSVKKYMELYPHAKLKKDERTQLIIFPFRIKPLYDKSLEEVKPFFRRLNGPAVRHGVHGAYPSKMSKGVSFFESRMSYAPNVKGGLLYPPVCYTFNVFDKNISEVSDNFIKKMEILLEDIALDEQVTMTPTLDAGQVSVHSRYNYNNPYMQGVQVTKGADYSLKIKKVIKKTLPWPYETDCFDYIEKVKRESKPGPTNKMECIEHCKLQKSLKNFECVLHSIWYPHVHKKCQHSKEAWLLQQYHEECSSQCPEACTEDIFDITKEELVRKYDIRCDDNVWARLLLKQRDKREPSIVFSFNHERLVYETLPKYDVIEVMSNIGGFIGMWLGLSIIAILNVVETSVAVIWHAVQKSTRKTKRKICAEIF